MSRHVVLLSLLLAGCSHLLVTSPSSVYDEATVQGAHLVTREGLALVSVGGTPEDIGRQLGALVGEPMRTMHGEFFELVPPTPAQRAQALARAVPADHHRELQMLSLVADVPFEDALVANLVVDSACTAFVASGAATASGELLFARNMDFPPAHLLGPGTLVLLVRPVGKKAFVSLGWPGITGVVTGMNEDGLCAAILVNFAGHATETRGATPLPYVVREVLERCATVEEASAFLRASAPASGHFVMLADARTAAVVEPGAPDRLPVDCLLTCSNGEVAPEAGLQTDERARALGDLVDEHRGRLDLDLARSILGATYLDYINAQAVVFEPATRRVSIAVGTTLRPAALQDWVRLDLAQAFGAGGFELAEPEALDDVDAFPHYREHPYAGTSIARRYLAAVERIVAEQEADPARTDAQRVSAYCHQSFVAGLRLQGPALEAVRERLTRATCAAVDRLCAAERTPGEELLAVADELRWSVLVDGERLTQLVIRARLAIKEEQLQQR